MRQCWPILLTVRSSVEGAGSGGPLPTRAESLFCGETFFAGATILGAAKETRDMGSKIESSEIRQLLQEAAEARKLASEIRDPASTHDLIEYAAQLESEAVSLSANSGSDENCHRGHSAQLLASRQKCHEAGAHKGAASLEERHSVGDP